MEMDAETLAGIKEQMYRKSFDRLFPLLDLKDLTLTLVGETTVGDRQAIGVQVSSPKHQEVTLYFDKASGLLVKLSLKQKNASGQEVLREEQFSDFKSFGGVKQGTKQTTYADGRKIIEGKVVELKFSAKTDDSLFARP